jgi:hypothetical protein
MLYLLLVMHALHACVAILQIATAALLHVNNWCSAGLNLLLAQSCCACTVSVLRV